MLTEARALKSFFTKVATGVAALVSGGWTVFIWTADWISRLAVGDAWSSDAKKMPEWVHLVATTSPWLPGVTCVGLGLWLVFLNWPRKIVSRDVRVPPKTNPMPTTSRGVISDMLIVDGSLGQVPSFRGRFAENGAVAIFYLEYSTFYPTVGAGRGWTLPRKFEVFRQERFGRSLSITFPIVSQRPGSGSWKLGVNDDDMDLINPSSSYKGRITVLDANEREQHVYFILLPRGGEVPTVLGQQMFDHLLEWEGAATRTGDAESLFS